ncbi:MAG: carbohydrate-binding domain-containing protein [Lachnospiraceae bacterium]|nr:carbohydrate-binding domain-containing protein [Lachnospiraceae bacterium]
MKKNCLKLLAGALCAGMLLAACGDAAESGSQTDSDSAAVTGEATEAVSQTVSITEAGVLEDFADSSLEATGEFAITGDGVSQSGSVYTITQAGEYILTGRLEGGSVVISISDEDQVKLILDGTVIYSADSAPVQITGGDEVEIEAAAGTYNVIADGRENASEDEEIDAAIYCECDLKLSGSGILIVDGSFDNGVKSKDDVTVKELSLKVTAVGNAIKGNDTVKIKSGNLILISTDSDGIKTKNSDVSSKGNQRGTVTIEDGHIDIFSESDGIDAAYDVVVSGASVVLNIFTSDYTDQGQDTGSATIAVQVASKEAHRGFGGSFGGFGGNPFEGSSGSKDDDGSHKGIKAANEVTITGGSISIKAIDDAIHANGGDELENGSNGAGAITVSSAEITIVSGDDALHADTELNIKSGTLNIKDAREGLEANQILISGGSTFIYSTDDGINVSGNDNTPLLRITGGYVDVTTSSGDTDAIDSNGNIEISGGFVLVKGGSSAGGMSGSIDVDGSITMTGGTVVALGGICELPSGDSVNIYADSSLTFSQGSFVLVSSSGEEILSFELSGSYSSCWIASEKLVLNETYTMKQNGSELFSWTQASYTVGSAGNAGFGGMGGAPGSMRGGPGGF